MGEGRCWQSLEGGWGGCEQLGRKGSKLRRGGAECLRIAVHRINGRVGPLVTAMRVLALSRGAGSALPWR